MSKLKTAGLYIAEHLSSHEQFLVAIEGVAPMLRITNVISITEFATNTKTMMDPADLMESITDQVNGFDWITLQCKIAIDKEKKSNKDKSLLNDYKCLETHFDEYCKLSLVELAKQIAVEEDITIENAMNVARQFLDSVRQ
jgi:hypothetical protein